MGNREKVLVEAVENSRKKPTEDRPMPRLMYKKTPTGVWVYEYDPAGKPRTRSDWWDGPWHAKTFYADANQAAYHVKTGKPAPEHSQGPVSKCRCDVCKGGW
jgi:hypothetical protein